MIAATTTQNNLFRLQLVLPVPGNTRGWKQPRDAGMNYLGSQWQPPLNSQEVGLCRVHAEYPVCALEMACKTPERRRLMPQTSATQWGKPTPFLVWGQH